MYPRTLSLLQEGPEKAVTTDEKKRKNSVQTAPEAAIQAKKLR